MADRIKEPQSNVITTDRFAALQQELAERSRQQTAVAELGEAALTRIDCDTLIGEACALVADTLQADVARVLEYLPSERRMVVRSLVGYTGPREMYEADSEAMFTFHSADPVVIDDLAAETRFDGAPVLDRLGVVSGISVSLPGRSEAFGVIGAFTRVPRRFRTYEIEFLQSVANVLGAAIESRRTHEELERSITELSHRERLGAIGSWSWSRGLRDWLWSDGLYEILGAPRDTARPSYVSFLGYVHPGDRPAFSAIVERAFTAPGEHELEHRIVSPEGTTRIVNSTVETIFGSDRKPLRIVGTTRDITRIAEAQEQQVRLAAFVELAAQEWRMTCDAVDALLIVTDASGTVLRLNEQARRALGATYDEAIGRDLPTRGEPWATMRQLITVVAETHLSTSGSCREGKNEVSWEINARVLSDDRFDEQRIVLIVRDVTDLERREEIRRLGDVSETVNHVIGEIVRRGRPAIQKIILSIDGPEGPVRALSDSALVRSSANELASLFADLGEYVKPLQLDAEPGSLVSVVARVLEASDRPSRAKRISVRSDVTRNAVLAQVMMNRVRLQRLVIDLTLIFIERGEAGDEVTVTLDQAEWNGEPVVRLSITGTREIFTPEEIKWSLEPVLPRINATIALRLSVCRRLAEEHGASMMMANRASDHSSMVVLRFPQIG